MVNRNHQGETRGEKLLRKALINAGIKFIQEAEILGYHVDFLINPKVVVEVDGYIHLSKDILSRDAKKERILNDHGYTVLRISDAEVSDRSSLNTLLSRIKQHQTLITTAEKTGLSIRSLDIPQLKTLKDKLQAQEIRARQKDEETDEALFLKAIEKMQSTKKR